MSSRRAILSAVLAAIPVGIGASFGMRHWLTGGMSVRLLGRDDSMLALFDTGNERVLLLLGEPHLELLANLSHLLPVGQTRIDMIVGSHAWLTVGGARSHLDLQAVTTLSVQASASAPPIRGNVYPVTSTLRFQVGDTSDALLLVGHDHDSAATNPDMSVEISAAGTRLLFASGGDALGSTGTPLHLLAVPGEVSAEKIAALGPEILATTSPAQDVDLPSVQVFPQDVVSFAIHDGAVKVREDYFFS